MMGGLVSNLFNAWGNNLYISQENLDRMKFSANNYTEEKIKINSVDINIKGYHEEVTTIKDLLLTFQFLPTGDNTKCSTKLLYDAGYKGVPQYVEAEFKGQRNQVRVLVNFVKSEYGEPKKQSGPTFFQQMRGYNGIEECKEEKEKYLKEASLAALHKLTDVYGTEPSTGRKAKLLEKLSTGVYGFCDEGRVLSVDSYVQNYCTLGNVINDVKEYHFGVETSLEYVKQMLTQKGIDYEKKLLSLSSRCSRSDFLFGAPGPVTFPRVVHEKTIEKLDKVLFVVEELVNSPSYGQQEKGLEPLDNKSNKGESK